MVRLLAAVVSALAVALVGTALVGSDRSRPSRQPRSRNVPGLDVSTTQFWTTVAAAAAGTFVAVFALTGLVVVSLVPTTIVATLPKAYFTRKRARRLANVQESWPDGLRDILSSLRSGSSLPHALESLAVSGPEPLRQAFSGFDVYSRSLGVIQALEMIKDDLADPTADRIVEVLILAYERGGSVVPSILSDLADATTRDLWTSEQIRTEALEQKINSRVVFVLPWLVLIAMTARSGAFRDFYSTRPGAVVVLVGGVMSLIGIAVAARLGTHPAEPRVFGGRP